MKYRERFQDLFYLDPTSPTGLRKYWNDLPAGVKKYKKDGSTPSYQWVVRDYARDHLGIPHCITWQLRRCLYELAHDCTLYPDEYIYAIDGDRDNLSIDNLAIASDKDNQKLSLIEVGNSWKEFKNVILPVGNPDYYKHPSQWTNAEALKKLEEEKELRKEGISRPPDNPLGKGRPTKWR